MKLKALKNFDEIKEGELFESSKKSAENLVKEGFAEYLVKSKLNKSQIIKNSNTEMQRRFLPYAKKIIEEDPITQEEFNKGANEFVEENKKRKELEEKKEKWQQLFPGYDLKKDKFGYLFTKMVYPEKGAPYEREVADFDNIQREEQTIFDMMKNKIKEKEEIFFKIGNEGYSSSDHIELKNLLKLAKRGRATINRTDEIAFWGIVKTFDKEKIKKTNCYGFVNRKYLDYPSHKIYNTTYRQIGHELKEEHPYTSPSDSYLEFIELKDDKEKVDKLINCINNKYPRSKIEKIYHKLIFSWSISSCLKMVLKKNGTKLHPILIGLGAKRKGKSTAMEMFITSLWNNTLLQPDHFEGTRGTRLKQLDNTLFPLYCDELISLDRFAEILKNATIRGYMKIPRGRKDGSVDDNVKFFNLAISSNKYTVKDPALKDRMIIFDYGDCGDSKISEMEITWMSDNMKHLGKFLYNSFKDFDFEEMIKELTKKYKNYKDRDVFKLIYIDVGSRILEYHGILKDVNIPTKMKLGSKDSISMGLKDIIKEILTKTITNFTIPFKDGDIFYNVSIKRILQEPKHLNATTFDHLSAKGIYISQGFSGIIITKGILHFLNEGLKRLEGTPILYKDLSTLASDLDLKETKDPIKIQKSDDLSSSVRGLRIFDKSELVEFFDEKVGEEEVK